MKSINKYRYILKQHNKSKPKSKSKYKSKKRMRKKLYKIRKKVGGSNTLSNKSKSIPKNLQLKISFISVDVVSPSTLVRGPPNPETYAHNKLCRSWRPRDRICTQQEINRIEQGQHSEWNNYYSFIDKDYTKPNIHKINLIIDVPAYLRPQLWGDEQEEIELEELRKIGGPFRSTIKNIKEHFDRSCRVINEIHNYHGQRPNTHNFDCTQTANSLRIDWKVARSLPIGHPQWGTAIPYKQYIDAINPDIGDFAKKAQMYTLIYEIIKN
jgi:hypothetical protein